MDDRILYEYAVMRKHPGNLVEFWRTDISLSDAKAFINEWIADGGNPDTFYIVYRPSSLWKKYEND